MSKLSKETHLVMKLVKSRVDLYQLDVKQLAQLCPHTPEYNIHTGELQGSNKVLSILVDIRKEMEGK